MATVKEAFDNFSMFTDGFMEVVKSTVYNNKSEFVDYVHEQLMTGVDGDGKKLSPGYLEDPYFKTKSAAKKYAMWKKQITPPMESYLGIPARSVFVPNLFINGYFYSLVEATPTAEGLSIGTSGDKLGLEVESKYKSNIFRIGELARKHFFIYMLTPAMKNYYAKFGL